LKPDLQFRFVVRYSSTHLGLLALSYMTAGPPSTPRHVLVYNYGLEGYSTGFGPARTYRTVRLFLREFLAEYGFRVPEDELVLQDPVDYSIDFTSLRRFCGDMSRLYKSVSGRDIPCHGGSFFQSEQYYLARTDSTFLRADDTEPFDEGSVSPADTRCVVGDQTFLFHELLLRTHAPGLLSALHNPRDFLRVDGKETRFRLLDMHPQALHSLVFWAYSLWVAVTPETLCDIFLLAQALHLPAVEHACRALLRSDAPLLRTMRDFNTVMERARSLRQVEVAELLLHCMASKLQSLHDDEDYITLVHRAPPVLGRDADTEAALRLMKNPQVVETVMRDSLCAMEEADFRDLMRHEAAGSYELLVFLIVLERVLFERMMIRIRAEAAAAAAERGESGTPSAPRALSYAEQRWVRAMVAKRIEDMRRSLSAPGPVDEALRAEIRGPLEELLDVVRFPQVDKRDLFEQVEQLEVVSDRILKEAYRYHAMPDRVRLVPSQRRRMAPELRAPEGMALRSIVDTIVEHFDLSGPDAVVDRPPAPITMVTVRSRLIESTARMQKLVADLQLQHAAREVKEQDLVYITLQDLGAGVDGSGSGGSGSGHGKASAADQTEKLLAHKLMLQARVEHFRVLFRSGMRDAIDRQVVLDLTRAQAMEVLKFIYSGRLSSDMDGADLLACYLFSKYVDDSALNEALLSLARRIAPRELFLIMAGAKVKESAKELYETCLERCTERTLRVFQTPDFLLADEVLLLDIVGAVASHEGSYRERDLRDLAPFVAAWINFQCEFESRKSEFASPQALLGHHAAAKSKPPPMPLHRARVAAASERLVAALPKEIIDEIERIISRVEQSAPAAAAAGTAPGALVAAPFSSAPQGSSLSPAAPALLPAPAPAPAPAPPAAAPPAGAARGAASAAAARPHGTSRQASYEAKRDA
jgi:hypothetical protein